MECGQVKVRKVDRFFTFKSVATVPISQRLGQISRRRSLPLILVTAFHVRTSSSFHVLTSSRRYIFPLASTLIGITVEGKKFPLQSRGMSSSCDQACRVWLTWEAKDEASKIRPTRAPELYQSSSQVVLCSLDIGTVR